MSRLLPDERVRLVATGTLAVALLAASLATNAAPAAPTPQPGSPGQARELGGTAGRAGDYQGLELVEHGRAVFRAKGCIFCHSAPGVQALVRGGTAPDLTRLGAMAATRKPGMSAERYVRESIVAPQAFVVPGYSGVSGDPGNPAMPLVPASEAELDALVAFLLSPP